MFSFLEKRRTFALDLLVVISNSDNFTIQVISLRLPTEREISVLYADLAFPVVGLSYYSVSSAPKETPSF